MSDFQIELAPTHNEVRIGGAVTPDVVARILEELRGTPGFPHRHAVWIFEDDVAPPPHPEFGSILGVIRDALRGADPEKRVALVMQRGLNRALLEMFRSDAVGLGFAMRVFTDRGEALAWLAAGHAPGPNGPA